MNLDDILEPYERLIDIKIGDAVFSVPENNSILRCLQFLDMDRISHSDLCWNGECINCRVWVQNGQKEKPVMACRTKVSEGMQITRMSPCLTTDFKP